MKQRYLAILFSALLVFGVWGVAAPQGAEAASAVGYVNVQRVFATHPDTAKIRSQFQEEQQKAQQDFDANAKSLPDQEKAAYMQKLTQQLAQKEQDLMAPLQKKIAKAIEQTAKAKGVDTVVNASVILYGGQDLTNDVIKAAK